MAQDPIAAAPIPAAPATLRLRPLVTDLTTPRATLTLRLPVLSVVSRLSVLPDMPARSRSPRRSGSEERRHLVVDLHDVLQRALGGGALRGLGDVLEHLEAGARAVGDGEHPHRLVALGLHPA